MKKTRLEYVLWGLRPGFGPEWIKLSGGTLAQCFAQNKVRKKELGWCGLVIFPKGEHPCGEKAQPPGVDAPPLFAGGAT